jgi:type III secretion protein L
MRDEAPLPSPGKRILRAVEAEQWLDGYALLEQAREQSRCLLERSAEDVRQARALARAEGLAQGQAAASQLLADTQAGVERYLAGIENRLVELSLGLLRQVLDDLDAAALIAGLCQRALRDWRDEQSLTLQVPVAEVERVSALLAAHAALQVRGDASLGPRQARLSSPAALIDLDVDEQLQGLRTALGSGAQGPAGAGPE